MSSDLTSLMKKKYGVHTSSKLTFTTKDTLFGKFRKLAKNIYKNGEWTEDDLVKAAQTIAQGGYELYDLNDKPIYKIRPANPGEIENREVDSSQDNYKSYIGERFDGADEFPQHVLLDTRNKSLAKSGQVYYFKYNHEYDFRPHNLDLAIGYDKIVRDIIVEAHKDKLFTTGDLETQQAMQKTLSTKLRLLTNSRYSSAKYANNFMREDVNPDHYRFVSEDYLQQAERSNQVLDFVNKYINNTYDVVLQQEYIKDIDKQTRASAWETKKNINQETQLVMDNSNLNESFASIELDNDVDLKLFKQFEDEMVRVKPILPTTDAKAILRLRKLGNYKALGLYRPGNNTIAVDFRDGRDDDNGYTPGRAGIQSFIHEYGHFIDFTAQDENLSMEPEFQDIVRRYQDNISTLDPESYVVQKSEYYGTPTEVFARGFEMYVSQAGLDSSFIKSKDTYVTSDEYRIFDQFMQQKLTRYFENKFPDLASRIQSLDQVNQTEAEMSEQVELHVVPDTTESEKKPLTFESVSIGDFDLEYEIPHEVGKRYEELTSFNRGRDFNKEVKGYMVDFVDQFEKFRTEDNKEELDQRLSNYNKLVVQLKTDSLATVKIPSVMIVGPGNYPAERKNRETERVMQLEGELYSDSGTRAKFIENTRKIFDSELIQARENVNEKRQEQASENGWKNFYKELDHPELAGIGMDTENSRIYIKTKGKPSVETRQMLKNAAMRWSPKNARWQRILTKNAESSLNSRVLEPLGLGKVADYLSYQPDRQEKQPETKVADGYKDTKIHVSKEQELQNMSELIKQARGADILDFVEKSGIEVYQSSNDEYRLKEHDSCVIKPSKNLFYWNSRAIGGDVIEFAKNFTVDQGLSDKKQFKEAVKQISDMNVDKFEQKEQVHEPFKYNFDNVSSDFSKAEDYLVNTRKLDSGLVHQMHDLGYIHQNNHGNVQFTWLDPKTVQIVGASEQGTDVDFKKYPKRGTMKKIQKNSEANFGFSFGYGEPKNLVFFESSIDALSYASLHNNELANTRLVSMEGLKPQTAMNYISMTMDETKKLPESVKFGVDNDEAGNRFIERMQRFQLHDKSTDELVKLEAAQPLNGKDWNEVLQKGAEPIVKKSIVEAGNKELQTENLSR